MKIHLYTVFDFLIGFLIQSPKHFIGKTIICVMQGMYTKVDQHKEETIMEHINESQKENFEDVDSIVFSANITNEEALLFQRLKEKQEKRLICPEAKEYQDFLNAYSSSSGYHVFKGDLETLAASDVVISLGVWFPVSYTHLRAHETS